MNMTLLFPLIAMLLLVPASKLLAQDNSGESRADHRHERHPEVRRYRTPVVVVVAGEPRYEVISSHEELLRAPRHCGVDEFGAPRLGLFLVETRRVGRYWTTRREVFLRCEDGPDER